MVWLNAFVLHRYGDFAGMDWPLVQPPASPFFTSKTEQMFYWCLLFAVSCLSSHNCCFLYTALFLVAHDLWTYRFIRNSTYKSWLVDTYFQITISISILNLYMTTKTTKTLPIKAIPMNNWGHCFPAPCASPHFFSG